jgi:hypothetical protein
MKMTGAQIPQKFDFCLIFCLHDYAGLRSTQMRVVSAGSFSNTLKSPRDKHHMAKALKGL